MVCIYCKQNTAVSNSRLQKRQNSVWRRRTCHARMTSVETYDLSSCLVVEKRSGALEPFYRDKLLLSLALSLNHRTQALRAASELCSTVISKLLKNVSTDRNISTTDISYMAILVLKRFDATSAIKYQSFLNPATSAKAVRYLLRETPRQQ